MDFIERTVVIDSTYLLRAIRKSNESSDEKKGWELNIGTDSLTVS